MPIKVLAFASSPRRGGNSETLLDWLLASMGHEHDVAIEKVVLIDADVNPCRGCNACEKLNYCVQRDGMDSIHDKIIDADIIVFASPIFCMGIPAQGKSLIDRAQVFRSRKYVLKLPIVPPERKGKRMGIYLGTSGQTWDHVFEGAIMSVKCLFHVIDVADRDIRYLLIRGVDEKGAILSHPTAKTDVEKLGPGVITELRSRLQSERA
ncbi:MAG: flavodoxin family protein [Methanomicrobiales archaeon]|nr:flavodoxin family protein [Methanomicrobiales archaeon]